MQDKFGRTVDYLRVSVTDLCNFRCTYCMPEHGVPHLRHTDILSLEEIEEIARAAVALGIRKIRLTGGEPLVRRGILTLCSRLASIPGLEDLAITTNGARLAELARPLRDAGVKRINISLDTLDPGKFAAITRCGDLQTVLHGIRCAADCGFSPLKLNTVLIGGFNDGEIVPLVDLTRCYPIEVRFIELMPIGCAAAFPPSAFVSCDSVLSAVPALAPVEEDGGVARRYRVPGAPGTVGLIQPLSHHFCASCNRLRLTSDGKLKPCLHSAEEIPVRGLHGDALRDAFRAALLHKPQRHVALSATEHSDSRRGMHQIGG